MSQYLGFSKLQGKIEAEGKSPKVAAAIAASVGRKKYGNAKMAKASAKGVSLKNSKPKGK